MAIKTDIQHHSQIDANDLVWARIHFCPFWPAKVIETPFFMGKTPPDKICVFFFGTERM